MNTNFQQKIDKLIVKIKEMGKVDYASRASVRAYNRNQDWILKTFDKFKNLSEAEFEMIVALTQNSDSQVRANIAWKLICWRKLPFDELKKYYTVLLKAIKTLNEHARKDYELEIGLWKRNMIAISNEYDERLES